MKEQHIEFFHKDHFEYNYHRTPPVHELSDFVDFFWETDFNHLWSDHPDGFSDILFPNIGYTYLINLGTSFTMQLGNECFEMKSDGFLPRPTTLECHHRPGNHLFGIKFRISPVLFERKINFGEYRNFITPLTYLIDATIIHSLKAAASFSERVALLTEYFKGILVKYSGSFQPVHIVRSVLSEAVEKNNFTIPIESIAAQHNISARTLQRYFEATTGNSSKKALQILRIRKAVSHLASSSETFHYSLYGYYDHSHFFKHLKSFLSKSTLNAVNLHLKLLEKLHKPSGDKNLE